AVLLGEPRPEAMRVACPLVQRVFEQVALDVEYELVAAHCSLRGLRLGRGGLRDPVAAAGRLRPRLLRTRVEDEQRGGGAHRREQELPAAHPQAPGVPIALLPGPANGL